jgi:hypothetical protein
MWPATVGTVVFLCTFGAALLGMWLRAVLPHRYLDTESRGAVQLGIGLVATMTALVLGLVTASAKSSYDAVAAAVKDTAIDLLDLDRVLARYGSESGEIRRSLKRAVGAQLDRIWPTDSAKTASLDSLRSGGPSTAEGIANAIRRLQPRDDFQRALQLRASELAAAVLRTRWLALADTGSSVPVPFLVILLFWLTIIFASFGLSAPRNTLVVMVFVMCALSVAAAIFLVLEMDGPFEGVLKVSGDPLRQAHAHLDR